MNLFINGISKNACLILFDEKREIKLKSTFEIKGNESSLLMPKIDDFLKQNNLDYFQLKNIVLVNGPGSFTGVRTCVLAVNTISFITKTFLTPINFFDLFSSFPIVKTSSKKDCFLKKDKNSKIEIISNEDLEKYLEKNNIKEVFGDGEIKNIRIFENIDYSSIIKNIELKKLSKIEALYIKKPNIC